MSIQNHSNDGHIYSLMLVQTACKCVYHTDTKTIFIEKIHKNAYASTCAYKLRKIPLEKNNGLAFGIASVVNNGNFHC